MNRFLWIHVGTAEGYPSSICATVSFMVGGSATSKRPLVEWFPGDAKIAFMRNPQRRLVSWQRFKTSPATLHLGYDGRGEGLRSLLLRPCARRTFVPPLVTAAGVLSCLFLPLRQLPGKFVDHHLGLANITSKQGVE